MKETINVIQVSVQSAEVTLVGHDAIPALVANCSLMNIARGNMVLTLKPTDVDKVGAIGVVEIEKNRPVMLARASVSVAQFNLVLNCLQHIPPRPVTLILALQDSLTLTSDGYLDANGQDRKFISDLSWSIPIL
ncbi:MULTISPECIES: hypothetical protein [Yoonia]|jgi:hypothetical protein|uniref:Uncharacterized protein n=1 Tax=Yoonia vestfoldensis SKA53 TaxID=314232 RepID=A3V253_9RHOB|nr:hypothetical protein [Yoonia vestfoldensis]EAQ07434.1 hypothetical protein SKA53_11393 [Yoonia vestfoldensis SKA53]